ncbi:MAG: hypothetical protein KW788_04595, partial [Candidatus Doudnabacteria bacterium]|nr:hypothetical protein [Candidatus Doudnabacteria bacterium]
KMHDGDLDLQLINAAIPAGLIEAERKMLSQLSDPKRVQELSTNLSDTHSRTRLMIMEKIYLGARLHINPSRSP